MRRTFAHITASAVTALLAIASCSSEPDWSANIVRCDSKSASSLEVLSAAIAGNQLHLGYPACDDDVLKLCWNGEFNEEAPTNALVAPFLDKQAERPCQVGTQTASIPLDAIIAEHRRAYNVSRFQISLEGWAEALIVDY